MSFSCQKGEFDRFFNQLDLAVEEWQTNRQPNRPIDSTGFRLWPTSSGPNPARTRKYKPEPGPNPKTNFKPKSCPRKPKVKLGLKNLAMLSDYFGYIFMHLRQKVRLRPKINPKFFFNFRPKPGPNPNPTRKARPDLQLCYNLWAKQFSSIKMAEQTFYALARSPNQKQHGSMEV